VDFVDIDPVTWNMSVPRLREKLAGARASGRLPKVVVPVHFAGQPTDQEAIWSLAREFGFRVVEDASHAIGASRGGEAVGSCRWSDITIFSFHPVKIITTGEGGMALTNDDELAERMRLLRSHGITRDAARFRGEAAGQVPPGWYYEQQLLGYNYRMTDIQGALGLSQLERLSAYVERRNELAVAYDAAFKGMPVQRPVVTPGSVSAFHLYLIRLGRGVASCSRRQLFDELRAEGVGVNLHYMPVHLQPYYRDLGFAPGYCPEAELHAEEAITLPLYPGLTSAQQSRVVGIIGARLNG
jgi:dTDP-4-amino-4,6-dideoxygalactose transaminase